MTHVTPEDIAAFIDGTVGEDQRDHVRDHLRTCPTCYVAYADTVRRLGAELDDNLSDPPESLIRVAESIGGAGDPATRRVGQTRRTPRSRPLLAIAAAAVVIALAVRFWPITSPDTGRIPPDVLAPIETAVMRANATGRLVLPGVALESGNGDVAFRSGATADKELVGAVASLAESYKTEKSAESAFWLINGYVAAGLHDNAAAFLADARTRFPDDARFEFLAAVHAYAVSDLTRARDLFETIVANAPNNGPAMLNLGIVLSELGEGERSREVLRTARDRFTGTAVGDRAQSILPQD